MENTYCTKCGMGPLEKFQAMTELCGRCFEKRYNPKPVRKLGYNFGKGINEKRKKEK